MNTFANAIIDNATRTRTENGAVTYSTSLDSVVDLFFTIGAKRGQSYEQIAQVFGPAFKQDPSLAFRVALWVRDIREGAGERQTFRHILRFLIEKGEQEYFTRAINAIIDLGRFDDLFTLLDDKAIAPTVLNRIQWELIENRNGLAAKWIPRKMADKLSAILS